MSIIPAAALDADGMVRRNFIAKIGDNLEYVLTDGSVDRMGDVIEPDGWDLTAFLRHPIALFNHDKNQPIGLWENLRRIAGKLVANFVPAEAGTSARIDEMRSLARQGILAAVSVGFKPQAAEPLDGKDWTKGIRFLKQQLLEVSLVTVPANANALHVARGLGISDATLSRVFGEQADEDASGRGGATGVQAAPPLIRTKTMSSLSEQIQNLQADLVANRERLAELNDADVMDCDAIEAVSSEIETQSRQLRAKQVSEAQIAGRAPGSGFTEKPERRMPAEIIDRNLPARRPLGQREIDPMDLFIRRAVVQVQSVVTGKSYDEILHQRYPGHADTEVVVKAAVSGASTTAAGWAAELVETSTQAFMDNLSPLAAFPALAASGMSVSFGPNAGAIKIPSRALTPSISGSFVGEAAPIPVRKLGLTTKTLNPHKMGVISVFSREIAKYSNPTIESVIREAIREDTAITVDSLLLDATAGSAVRPAGLTNGLATLTPTAITVGSEHLAVIGDLKKLIGAYTSSNRSIGNLRLLMNPAQDLSLALMPGPLGTGFGWTEQFMSRFNPIVSGSIPLGDVFLIDVSDFVTAVGVPEFDLSEEAVLHMEDTTPLQIGTTGTPTVVAAPVQSMFQTAQIAIRMLWDITWNTRRAGSVAWIDNVLW